MMKSRVPDSTQPFLPGGTRQRKPPETNKAGGHRIPHLEILRAVQDPSRGSANIVETYRLEVLPIKTRTIHLLGRKAPARIIETLLGYEVKAQYKRIQCPDMVTARYVKLFTEFGCRTIHLPYDPTVTARLLPEFERAAEAIRKGVGDLFPQDRPVQVYVLRQLYKHLRAQLKTAAKRFAPESPDGNVGLS
jgi:hypothetical protein